MNALFELIGRHGEPIAWWQMCLRASLIFLIGLAYVRIAGARAFGKWGALDILLAIIIGSNLSRTITGGAPFFATLVATAWLIALHYVLAHAAAVWPGLGFWLKGRPVRLVSDGAIDEGALRRHGIGRGDLEQALRAAGHADTSGVAAAYLERSGAISVITRCGPRPTP